MLKRQKEIVLVGEAENGKELLEKTEIILPDIIIMDIKMPVMDGIVATREITEKWPDIYVIAFTMFDDDDLVIDMLEAGAKGYLLKNAHKTEIIEAIKTVYNREPYYCNQTTKKLANLIAKSRFNPFKKKIKPQFTNKELEVIKFICNGLSNKEIAAQLNLSVRTIEGHRDNIHEKIDVKNTAGIIIYAIKHGIYKI